MRIIWTKNLHFSVQNVNFPWEPLGGGFFPWNSHEQISEFHRPSWICSVPPMQQPSPLHHLTRIHGPNKKRLTTTVDCLSKTKRVVLRELHVLHWFYLKRIRKWHGEKQVDDWITIQYLHPFEAPAGDVFKKNIIYTNPAWPDHRPGKFHKNPFSHWMHWDLQLSVFLKFAML